MGAVSSPVITLGSVTAVIVSKVFTGAPRTQQLLQSVTVETRGCDIMRKIMGFHVEEQKKNKTKKNKRRRITEHEGKLEVLQHNNNKNKLHKYYFLYLFHLEKIINDV